MYRTYVGRYNWEIGGADGGHGVCADNKTKLKKKNTYEIFILC
jgi:hypothetical protein